MSGTKRWSAVSLSMVLLLLFASGCAELSPVDSVETGLPAGSSSGYPPITEELLQNGPAPGHPILTLEWPAGAMGVENWDYAEAWVERKPGGEVFTSQGSGCLIAKKALPQDTMVTVMLPEEGYAIVDFGPHPLQFQKKMWIVLSLNGIGISVDSPKRTRLTVFYYSEETGTYERYPSHYDPDRNALMCRTNHFSRYIIA